MEAPNPSGYFERRAEEERRAAHEAQDERAAQSHRELARRYEEQAMRSPLSPANEEPEHGTVLPNEFRIVP